MKRMQTCLLGGAVLSLLIPALLTGVAATKLKVTHAPGAPVFRTPVLGRPFATLPLNTVVDAESKQGEFWKVSFDFNGQKTNGYVHEVLVEEVKEAELQGGAGPLGPVKSQPEMVAEIELKIEECQYRVVRERDLPDQVDTLRSLLPKVFNLEDGQKQKQLACDIYHWTGQALSKQGDDARAIREFKNMFEVDFLTAKKAIKYVSDPNISQLITTAERQYNGTFVGYSLQVDTEPKEALLKIDGKVAGHSPDVLPLDTPNVTLEIEKEGYRTEKVVLSLTDGKTARSFVLQSVARTVRISSDPPGAAVFLDGKDTGRMTECDLGFVPFGTHKLTVRKERYADWEDDLVVAEGSGPISKAAILFAKTYFSIFIWGGPESKAFVEPRAISLDKDGSHYVIDNGPVRVRKFTRDRGGQPSWGEGGKAFKSLKQPAGIAVDGTGACYITDARASTVNKFDKNGRFVRKWGKPGAKSGELLQPTGIAVDANNDIYIVDSGNSRIVKYSPTGVVIKTWGKLGPDPGQFFAPTAVAVNTHGEIVVVDRGRIQKFTPDGESVAAFGKPDSAEAEIKLPVGVCCDGYDNIYVADGATHRVKKFQSNGRYIGSFGGNGSEAGQMLGLAGIAVDVKGSVIVLEKGNKRIQEFQPPEK